GIEHADLAGRTGRVGVPGGVLDDGVHGLFGGVAQRGEGAFQRPVVRYGGLREPRAVHVPEEVVLRADGRVDIGQYDSGAAHAAPHFIVASAFPSHPTHRASV